MRTGYAFAAALSLAACSGPDGAGGEGQEHIACAVDGAETLRPVCTVERAEGEAGTTLTIRHPGGGFRRLLVAANGIVAADGAVPAAVSTLPNGDSEVAVDGDLYRIPAARR